MLKKNKPKTSVNVDAVRREASKIARDAENKSSSSLPGDLARSHAEAAPGTIRRESPVEQEMGSAKYKQMIHAHNDKNKHILDRLPFTFPKKKIVRSHRSVVVECVECGYQHVGTEHTYGVTCPDCKTYRRVKNPEAERLGQEPAEKDAARVGMFGTASDLLELREKRRLAEEATKKGQ
ncbi:hypothetical protein LCGC14_2145280 [marine sediment metagenome]|uniref:Uncharacterized protein n=1 Tax=marine sediment metagenome TaxID=412755 RepID=A0A0F9DXI1_9ZZZZ|nr:hypothetical protein [Candidatus Aminicenantes bacterium]